MYNFKFYRDGFLSEETAVDDRVFAERMAQVAVYIQEGLDYKIRYDYTDGDFWFGKKLTCITFNPRGRHIEHVYQHID